MTQNIQGRRQMWRLTRIISLLKHNKQVTLQSIISYFHTCEYEEDVTLRCSRATISRDIKLLREDFKCPLVYDHLQKVYYLKDAEWDLPVPPILSEKARLAVVIGEKIASDLLPKTISGNVHQAVGELIRIDNTDKLGKLPLHALKILTCPMTFESEDIFLNIYRAWTDHLTLHISYENGEGKVTERDINPYSIIYYDMQWYVNGYCFLRQDTRTFSIARIKAARVTDAKFVPDEEAIKRLNYDTFFEQGRIKDVVIELNESGRQFAMSKMLHTAQKITQGKNGKYILMVPAIAKTVVVAWILQQKGDAVPMGPPEVVQAVRDAAKKVYDLCQ